MAAQTETSESLGLLRTLLAGFLFAVVLAMFPYSEDPTGDIKLLILTWASFGLAAAWLVLTWRTGNPAQRPRLFFGLLVLFLLLNFVACLRSSFVAHSLAELRKFWVLFVLYLIASQCYRTPRQIRRLMLVVCLAVAISSLYALLIQRTGHDPFPWRNTNSDTYTNLPATFGHPNYAAHTLVLAIVFAVYLCTQRGMLACLAFLPLFLIHLRFTHQRGGPLALAAALVLVVVGVQMFRRTRKPLRAVVSALVIVALVSAAGFIGVMGVHKLRTGSVYPLDLSLLIRYKSYCSAARMALVHPILGYGTGNYKIEYPPFWTPYEEKWFAEEFKMNAHVHNDLLEVACDAGLPAAGLYLALLMLGMSYGLLMGFTQADPGKRRLGFAFAAFFCVFLVDGLFGFNLRVPVSAALFFVMLGAFEGVWLASTADGAESRSPRRCRFLGIAIVALCLVCAVLDSGVFLSQMLLQRGSAEIRAKRPDRAEVALRYGEWLAPWNWNFARQRGVASLSRQDFPAAQSHFERALLVNPYYIMTMTALAHAGMTNAIAQVSTGQPNDQAIAAALDQAASYAQRILELSPRFAAAEDILGRVAMTRARLLAKSDSGKALEQWREAATHFLRAIQFGWKNPAENYSQLSQVRAALGDNDGAEEAMVRAIQADPSDDSNWPSFYDLARNLNHFERFRNVLGWRIERLQEKTPPDRQNLSMAYIWLAGVREEVDKDLPGAELALHSAVDCMPLRPRAWTAYATFAETHKRMDSFKAFLLESCDRLRAQGKQPLPTVAAVADVWRRGPEGLLDATVSLLSIVQGKLPLQGLQPRDLEMRWVEKCLLEEARSASLPAKDAGLILFHLGMIAAGVDDHDIADRVFPVAMPRLSPELQCVCAQYWADSLIGLKRPNEAANLLRDVSTRNPGNVDLKLALARSLVKCTKIAEAQNEYNALLQVPSLTARQREIIQAELAPLANRP